MLSPDGRTLVRMVYTSKSGRETGVIEQRRLAGGEITNLVRWQAEAQQPVPLPPIDLYPSGPLRMWFGANSDAIWLQTPCDLRVERGCMASAELDHSSPERLYRWRPSDPHTWQLLADGIAPGAVYDPQSNRFAWLQDGEIRVGRPI